MISQDDFTPTGDLRKDYMAYCEILNINPREKILSGIRVYLEDTQEEEEEVTVPPGEKSPSPVPGGKKGQQSLPAPQPARSPTPTKTASSPTPPARPPSSLARPTTPSTSAAPTTTTSTTSTTTTTIASSQNLSASSSSAAGGKQGHILVSVSDINNLTEAQKQRIKTELTVRGVEERLDIHDINALSRAITKCTLNVTKICLIGCGLDAESIAMFANTLTKVSSLRFLQIEMNPIITFNCNNSFGEPEQLISQLQQYMQKNSLPPNNHNFQTFSYFLRNTTKHLSLRGCNITDQDVAVMAEALMQQTSLLSLNLWGNMISDVGASHLAKALKYNQRLISLNLGKNSITDEGVKVLCSEMSPFTVSTEDDYDLVRNQVCIFYGETPGKRNPKKKPNRWELLCVRQGGTKKEPNLVYSLPGNISLKNLNLSTNKSISDTGAQYIIDLIRKMKQSRDKIKLCSGNMEPETTPVDTVAVSAALADVGMYGLTRVSIAEGTKVSKEMIELLHSELPPPTAPTTAK